MAPNKTRHYVIGISTTLLALVVGFAFFPVATVRAANPGQDSAASKATFRTKCAMCHGQDGGGSDVGKSMNVPDLRSQAVQKVSDAELAQIISNGKGGMPAFKNSLSEAQIHGLVTHIRSLAAKK
jgi:mono/diheme cytochrome c family protein